MVGVVSRPILQDKHFLHPQPRSHFEHVIEQICDLPWELLENDELMRIAYMYYFFSIQFRENLEIACQLYPNDRLLRTLHREECNTANLSPWNGIAKPGERMNHDEFVRRLLLLEPVPVLDQLRDVGATYLENCRVLAPSIRAMSIGSYEDQGLRKVFEAILRAPTWHGPGQTAFKYFIARHIEFDSDPDGGHGVLCQHLKPNDSILPLWISFRDILTAAAPGLLASRNSRNDGTPKLDRSLGSKIYSI
jgi:hypothetical protein